MNNLEYIRHALQIGDIQGAITQLSLFVNKSHPEYRDEIIIHAANLSHLLEQSRMGLIAYHDERIERNRIIQAITDILALIEKEHYQITPPTMSNNITEQTDAFSNSTEDRVRLRQIMEQCFSLEELRVLCFDLRIDYDNLNGFTKSGRIVDVIEYCERNGCINDLIQIIQRIRPGLL